MSVQIVIGIIKNEMSEIFISRRHEQLYQGNLWEFAGGKVEASETLEAALVRELKEELGISVIETAPLISLRHTYPEKTIELHAFEITRYVGEPQSLLRQQSAWVKMSELENYAFPAANKTILTALRLPPYYAILNDDEGDLLEKLNQLLDQNIKLIQARLKKLTPTHAREFLKMAYPLCQANNALLLVNSGVEQVFKIHSDGVHLTSTDLLKLETRPENLRYLSASCHNQVELQHAEKIGVDFVVLAPILKTQTHPNAKPLGWGIFEKWVSECHLPVYALGGVSKANLKTAKFMGGQGIAGIRTFLQ